MASSINSISIIPLFVSALVICIMLFSIYVTIKYRSPEQYKQTRLNVFFSTLASVAIIFVGMNIFLTSLSFENNQNFSRLTKTKEAIDKLFFYPSRLLIDFQHLRPEFRASFYMSNIPLYNLILLPNKKSSLTQQGMLEEGFVASVMYQAWEDCITFRKYDSTPFEVWVYTFLTWAQNPYFKAYYPDLKYGFRKSTREFATLLFEYAATIPVPTTKLEYYRDAIDNMMQDPRYIKLLQDIRAVK